MPISKLQYISQGESTEEHLNNIAAICKAGGKWIQLRLKNIDLNSYIETAIQAKKICQQYNASLIINDNVEVVQASAADGVHLGQGDLNWATARKILGKNAIIGATANTFEHIQEIKAAKAAVDYIGVGPFRHTTTKKDLSPILGLVGYQNLLKQMTWDIPIIAIGGIQVEDITSIFSIGVYGIAVSGLLTKNNQKTDLIAQIHKILSTNN